MSVSLESYRQLALSLPEVTEEPHFDKTSFRVRKRIFTTMDIRENRACMKLNEADQDVFTRLGGDSVCPVPGAWGSQGWTYLYLDRTDADLFQDMMFAAYRQVAPRKLGLGLPPEPGH